MKTENTTQKAINYLSIYANKSKDFEAFKYIQRSKSNPLQVSYIKQEKIVSLLEYTGIKIKGTAEQRKKYFVNTSISKLLSNMFISEGDKQAQISSDIDKQFRKDFTGNADFFISDDVKGFYSRENKEFIYNNNGSCMEGKPANYFEIYDNCYSIYHIKESICAARKSFFNSKSSPSFSVQIKADTFHELECYPYADTFRYGKELSENIKFSDDEDQSDYILEDTGGTYTEGSSGFCECCEDRVDEDYLHYSECEEEYLCDNCSEYIEEREDVCRENNATYNSYSGNYHYCHDL